MNPFGHHFAWYLDWKPDHQFSFVWQLDGENGLKGKKLKILKPEWDKTPLPRSSSQGFVYKL